MELPSRSALKQDKVLVRIILRGDVEAERVHSESHHFSRSMPPDRVVQTAPSFPPPQSISLPVPISEPVSDITQLEKKIEKSPTASLDKPALKNTLVLPTQPHPKTTLQLPHQAALKNTLALPGKPILNHKTLPANSSLPQNKKKSWLKHLNLDIVKLLSFGAFTAGLTAWLQNREQNNKSTLKAQAAAFQLEKVMNNCIITIQEASLLSQKYNQMASLLNSSDRGTQAFKSIESRKLTEKDLFETRTLYNAKLLELGDNINQLQPCFSSYRSTMEQKKNKAFSQRKEADKSSNRVLRYYSYLLGQLRNANPSMMSYKDLEKLAIVQSNLDQLIEKDSANIPIYTGYYKAPQVLVPPAIIPKTDPSR